MGLTLTAYQKVEEFNERVETTEYGNIDHEWLSDNNIVQLNPSRDYRKRADGLKGLYKHSGETFELPEGTNMGYHEYHEFRKELAKNILGTPIKHIWDSPHEYKDKPFYEFLNFPDNHGVIGGETCKKLGEDFENHESTAKALDTGEPFFTKYKKFEQLFKFAAEDGAVKIT